MDEWLRDFIYKKWKIGGLSFSFLDALLAVCITGTGVMLRMAVVEYTVIDAVKILAMALDFLLALLAAGIVYEAAGKSRNKAFLTYAILVIYPTMVANSALWGRNSVYYVFFFFTGYLLVVREKKLSGFLMILAGACMALGRGRLSTQSLTLGWPNIFELVGKKMFVDLYNRTAVLFLAALLVTMIYLYKKKRVELTNDLFVQQFLFMAILLPFFLPSMPAWAGYTADVAALVYAMWKPKKFYVPMLHLIVSYSAYANVLNGETKLPMPLYSVILLILLVDVGMGIYQEIEAQTR